jgi:hypothetical protein
MHGPLVCLLRLPCPGARPGRRRAEAGRRARLLSRTRQRLAALLPLVLALLLAQLGAQAHAYAHLAAGSQQDRMGAPARACVECSLSAPLLSGVAPAAAQPVSRVDALLGQPAPAALPCRATFQPPGFRSRAPPDSP